jgi:hypothetical protein
MAFRSVRSIEGGGVPRTRRTRLPTSLRAVLGGSDVAQTTGQAARIGRSPLRSGPLALRTPLLRPSLAERYASTTDPSERAQIQQRAAADVARLSTRESLDALKDDDPSTLHVLEIAAALGLPGAGLAVRGSISGARLALGAARRAAESARQHGKSRPLPTSTTIPPRRGLGYRHLRELLRHPATRGSVAALRGAGSYARFDDEDIREVQRRYRQRHGHWPPQYPEDLFN